MGLRMCNSDKHKVTLIVWGPPFEESFRGTFIPDPLPTSSFCRGGHTEDTDYGVILNGT